MNSTSRTWSANTFETAQAWILACMPDNVPDTVDVQQFADDIATICKKRRGVWSVLARAPRDTERAVIWHAFKNAAHAAQWGNLASWRESSTLALMRASETERDTHERVYNATLHLFRARFS